MISAVLELRAHNLLKWEDYIQWWNTWIISNEDNIDWRKKWCWKKMVVVEEVQHEQNVLSWFSIWGGKALLYIHSWVVSALSLGMSHDQTVCSIWAYHLITFEILITWPPEKLLRPSGIAYGHHPITLEWLFSTLKRFPNPQLERDTRASRNQYFHQIQFLKRQHWIKFLEAAKDKSIFIAYQYSRPGRTQSTLIPTLKFTTKDGNEEK